GRAAPSLVSGLAGPRDHLVAPDLLAIGDIMASHITAEAGYLAGAARDDRAVHDDGAAGILDEQVASAIALPDAAARASVQSHDEIVPGGENDFVAIKGNRTFALAMSRWELFLGRQWLLVFPEQVAGGGIDRLDHVARIAQIHDSVVDNRCDFVEAWSHRA